MNALRQAWASTVRNLGQLSGKDKTLIGALLIVGVMALLLVAVWSSKQTMVQLLPEMGAADQAAAVETLRDADIQHEMKGGKVYVAPEKRMAALAYLQQAGKLPEDKKTLFSALAGSQNWMSTSKDADRLANAAICEVLGGILSNYNGVEKASVMIDAPEPIGIGAAVRKPVASISVMMKSGRTMDRNLVDALANGVIGGKAGLELANIRVIDQRRGAVYFPRTGNGLGGISNGGGGGDYLDMVAAHERHIQEKVVAVVSRFDPLSMVTVSLTADNTVTRTNSEEYKKDGSGTVAVPEEVSSTEKRDAVGATSGASNAEPGGAAGLSSNITAGINNGSGSATPGTNSSTTTETTKSKVGLGKTTTETLSPGGMPTRVSVVVSLSREYITHLVKTRKGAPPKPADGSEPKVEEPTQAELDAAFAKEKERVEADLTPIIQNAAIEKQVSTLQRVTVSMFQVPQMGMAAMGSGGGLGVMGGEQMASAGGGLVGGLVGQLTGGPMAKTAFLGLLALVALGMMLMLVRKSSKPITLPSPEELAGLPPVIDAGDDVVGEADEGATAMEGIELGEAQIRTKKMLESIEEMVHKNPADAAGLMNRWMNIER